MNRKAADKWAPVRAQFLAAASETPIVYEHGPYEARLIDEETADELRPQLDELEAYGGKERDRGFTVTWTVDSGSPLGTWWSCLSCEPLDDETVLVIWNDNFGTGEPRPSILGFGRGPNVVRACTAVILHEPPCGGGEWSAGEAEENQERMDSELAPIELYRLTLATGSVSDAIVTCSDEDLARGRAGESDDFEEFCRVYFGT